MKGTRVARGLLALLLSGLCETAIGQPIDPVAASASPSRAFLPGVPLTDLRTTRERPLFVPSRRPPQVVAPRILAPAAPSVRVDEPPRLTLLGVIRAPEGVRSAVVMDETDHTSYTLRAGDNRRGWMVRSVDGDAVTLQRQDRTVRLSYQRATQSAPAQPSKTLPAN